MNVLFPPIHFIAKSQQLFQKLCLTKIALLACYFHLVKIRQIKTRSNEIKKIVTNFCSLNLKFLYVKSVGHWMYINLSQYVNLKLHLSRIYDIWKLWKFLFNIVYHCLVTRKWGYVMYINSSIGRKYSLIFDGYKSTG